MLNVIILIVYITLQSIILTILSLITPRLSKNTKETNYIFILIYIANVFILNNFFGISTYKTIIINFALLFLSYFLGSRLRVAGLTGQISSGKSTVGKYLETKHNAKVINIDDLNREVLNEESTLKEIRKLFGDEVFNSDGLDKIKLREIIFSDDRKRKQLERLTHMKVFIKLIFAVIREKLLKWTKLVFIENAILLRFKPLVLVCYPIISVCTSNRDLLIRRVMQRDNCSKEVAESVLSKQLNLEEFKNKSDVVIYNDSTLEELYTQIDNLLIKK
jgi:dephospho-CoA kinase